MYSKQFKNAPVKVTVTIPNPDFPEDKTKGEAITFWFRRWTNKEMNHVSAIDAANALTQETSGKPDDPHERHLLTLSRLAAIVTKVEGISDFPEDQRGLDTRFSEYFEDEYYITQEAYVQYQEELYKFFPFELAERISRSRVASGVSL